MSVEKESDDEWMLLTERSDRCPDQVAELDKKNIAGNECPEYLLGYYKTIEISGDDCAKIYDILKNMSESGVEITDVELGKTSYFVRVFINGKLPAIALEPLASSPCQPIVKTEFRHGNFQRFLVGQKNKYAEFVGRVRSRPNWFKK